MIRRQIEYNTAIAQEGLSGKWGGRNRKDSAHVLWEQCAQRAKAMAAAGSRRQNEWLRYAVVINSGSGNQGMTASLL